MGATSFMSGRLAPVTTRPRGTPCPSVSRLRLTPVLPRSVGLGAVFPPTQRRLCHRSVHTQPSPVQSLQFIKLFHPRLPEFQKHPRRYPLLKTIMGGGVWT